MTIERNWIPMRWRCGPMEFARLRAMGDGGSGQCAQSAKVAKMWADPEMLRLLDGTHVNCLVVDWAAGDRNDAAQQKALKPLLDAGRRLGVSFVGRVATQDGLAEIAEAGKAAGLDALMIPGATSGAPALPLISAFPRDSVDWDRVTETFVLNGNVWPRAVANTYGQAAGSDTVSAGPSRAPWVESNGWVALLAQEAAPGKRLWLETPLPETDEMLPAEKYCLAVADARAHGSRWMIDLDIDMREGLAERWAEATEAWQKIGEMDAFFDAHAQWEAAHPVGMLTVVSDFGADRLAMSAELLSMLMRQQIPFAVSDRNRSLLPALAAKSAILWMDEKAPGEEQHRQLLDFVEQGGLVIAPNYWGPREVAPYREFSLIHYDFYQIGKGRMVAASGGFSDAYALAHDARLIVGLGLDPLVLFGPVTTTCYTSANPEGATEIVQILNYNAPRPAEFVSLWVRGKVNKANLVSLEGLRSLESRLDSGGTRFDIPPVDVCYAVEIERNA